MVLLRGVSHVHVQLHPCFFMANLDFLADSAWISHSLTMFMTVRYIPSMVTVALDSRTGSEDIKASLNKMRTLAGCMTAKWNS